MKTVRPLIFLQPFLALGCASSPLDVSDETSEAGTTASPGDESSTGEAFDIDAWVGDYHHEAAFTLIGVEDMRATPPVSMFNFDIRPDHTATLAIDSCEREEPSITEYRIEPIDSHSLHLLSPHTDGKPQWGSVPLEYFKVTKKHCGGIVTESVTEAGHIATTDWSPGNVCWIIHCERTLSEDSYHVLIDYCDGEVPVECEPEPD